MRITKKDGEQIGIVPSPPSTTSPLRARAARSTCSLRSNRAPGTIANWHQRILQKGKYKVTRSKTGYTPFTKRVRVK